MKNDNFIPKNKFEELLKDRTSPEDITKILGAYEMSEAAHYNKLTPSGYPVFHHSTRVTNILISELGIFSTDLIIASLLHNVLFNTDDITISILEYNFGTEVTYMIQKFTDDYKIRMGLIDQINPVSDLDDECLMLILCDCLDILRSDDFKHFLNPFSYIQVISERYIPESEKRQNQYISKLISECKKEINKLKA